MDQGVLDKWPVVATGKACPTWTWNSSQTRESSHDNTKDQPWVERERILVGFADTMSWLNRPRTGWGGVEVGVGVPATHSHSLSSPQVWSCPEFPHSQHVGDSQGKWEGRVSFGITFTMGAKFLPNQSRVKGPEKRMIFFFFTI